MPPKDLDKPGELKDRSDFYDLPLANRYLLVFYYAILNILGNDIAPRATVQTLFSFFIALLGATTLAFIFGNMTALMGQMNNNNNSDSKISALEESNIAFLSKKIPDIQL